MKNGGRHGRARQRGAERHGDLAEFAAGFIRDLFAGVLDRLGIEWLKRRQFIRNRIQDFGIEQSLGFFIINKW